MRSFTSIVLYLIYQSARYHTIGSCQYKRVININDARWAYWTMVCARAAHALRSFIFCFSLSFFLLFLFGSLSTPFCSMVFNDPKPSHRKRIFLLSFLPSPKILIYFPKFFFVTLTSLDVAWWSPFHLQRNVMLHFYGKTYFHFDYSSAR